MRNIMCILLFTFIIFLNYAELWAADDPAHQLPPPGPNRFAGYPDGHTFFENRRLVGTMMNGRFVRPRFSQPSTSTDPPVLVPIVAAYLPDGAEVFRPPKGRIGFLFDRRINGPDEKGEVRVLAAQNGDVVIRNGKTLAKYIDGWKEFKELKTR